VHCKRLWDLRAMQSDSNPSHVTLTAVKSQNSRRFFSKAFSLE